MCPFQQVESKCDERKEDRKNDKDVVAKNKKSCDTTHIQINLSFYDTFYETPTTRYKLPSPMSCSFDDVDAEKFLSYTVHTSEVGVVKDPLYLYRRFSTCSMEVRYTFIEF